jgi:hypothetical protein
MELNSYATVYALGHREVEGIFEDPVIVEEKIDGSQFSFGLISTGFVVLDSKDSTSKAFEQFELQCRSKNHQMIIDAPEQMFNKAVESIKTREEFLHPGWIYRCEFLQKPHHNVLCYNRPPEGYIIGFDVATGLEVYLTYEAKKAEFARIGLETVPLLFQGKVRSIDQFTALLETISILGGTTIEGVVVKNYEKFTREKKVMIGKFVSEKFKEVANGEWRKANPTQGDITEILISMYRTPARWQKAVLHLAEQGVLENSPKDIGNLIREVQADVEKECTDEIKDILYQHFSPKVKRGIISGLPEWYKEELLKSAFEVKEGEGDA